MQAYPKSHIIVSVVLACSLAVSILTLPEEASTSMDSNRLVSLSVIPEAIPQPQQVTADIDEDIGTSSNEISTFDFHGPWEPVKIRRGDSLSVIFKRLKLPATELDQIIRLGPETKVLKRIFPGKLLNIRKDSENSLVALKYEINPLQTLVVHRVDSGFKASTRTIEPQVITAFKTGQISKKNPSLYQAGLAAGMSENVIMKLSYIFQWDVSFALDIRQGDSFTLMYEEIYADGEKIRDGDILAAIFINEGQSHTAVMYESEKGRRDYYTPDGKSLRKAFIRDPVHFSHVSSRFNLRRLHPIHKTVRPHRGIDYAAKRGTPIVAAGDGKVIVARQNRSSGKYITIQHGEQYTTKYLHLSNFANGVRSGKYVKQGQTIGYVGATGWATGPHLHYEFLVNGVHRNPRRVKLPNVTPIQARDKERFEAQSVTTLTRLYSLAGINNYASAEAAVDTPGSI